MVFVHFRTRANGSKMAPGIPGAIHDDTLTVIV